MNKNTENQSILFVDDEKGILKALRRVFIDEQWNLYFATSGSEGLKILKENNVDLVISDVRMPEMDGIEFLTQVRKTHPHVVRIYLTGYADQQSMVKALANGNAQQVLPKPWDDQELIEVVREALEQSVKQKQKYYELQRIINSLTTLPPMPQTYMKVKDYLSASETFSLPKAAEIIEKDISLCAELIRWSNSSLFGQRFKVESVQRALVVLGSEIAKGILLAGSVFKSSHFRKKKLPGFNNNDFYKHSIACAIISQKIIEHSPFNSNELKERAFTAGLIHDIGKLVEQDCLPEKFQEIIELANLKKQTIRWAEEKILATSHEEIGAYLAEWWNMPTFLVNTIRWHHTTHSNNFDKELIGAVHLANSLAHQFHLGESGNSCILEPDKDLLSLFNLDNGYLEELKKETIQSLI